MTGTQVLLWCRVAGAEELIFFFIRIANYNYKLQLIEIKVLQQTGKECFEEAKALFHMTSSQVMPGISAFTIPKHSRFFSPL